MIREKDGALSTEWGEKESLMPRVGGSEGKRSLLPADVQMHAGKRQGFYGGRHFAKVGGKAARRENPIIDY
jgi:hypothetical protein